MEDIQGKIYFVYTPEEAQAACPEKYDKEKDVSHTCSEAFGVLQSDGFHWCPENLGDGACVDDYETLECTLEVWDVQKRNQRLEDLQLEDDDMLISDIYEVQSKHLVLHPHVSVNIPANIPYSYVRADDMYDFYIKVMEEGEWEFIPASYKNGFVRAHLDTLQLLTVVARLKPEQSLITPNGAEFVSEKDPDVKVEFPKGALEANAAFQFVTETVDTNRATDYQNYNPDIFRSIVGFSTTVNVKHNLKGDLNKEVKVTLPIHPSDNGSEDGEVVFLRWHDDQIDIVEDIPKKENGLYSVSVKSFSAYSAVRVRSASVSASEIVNAARFLSGKENLCTLLCFLNFRIIPGMPVLLVDVVESCRVDEVAEEHKAAGLEEVALSRSRDIPLSDRERIRIELNGDITYAPGIPKQAYSLVFIKAAKKNHVTFPLKMKVSSTPFSIVAFVGHMSKWTHRVHFNASRGARAQTTRNLLPRPRVKSAARPKTGSRRPGQSRSGSVSSGQSRSGSFSSASGSINSVSGSEHSVTTKRSNLINVPTPRTSSESDAGQRLIACVSTSSVETDGSGMSSLVSLSSVAEDSVFEEKRHPTLCEKSLLVMSEQLPWSEWQKMAIEMGLTLTHVERISEEATCRHITPAFRMLHRWIATNSGRPDHDLVNDMACAFRELGRNDLADVVLTAEQNKLPLRRRDFLN